MYDFKLNVGDIDVRLNAEFVGKDILVWLTGGKAHIGAVAVAEPRPSLNKDGSVSADASVMTMGGHKEDQLARKVALALASKLNVKVTVVAGMHWDNVNKDQIEVAGQLCIKLTKNLLIQIVKERKARKAAAGQN